MRSVITILLSKSLTTERMKIPKKYGHYRQENCPFCGKPGVAKSIQGVPVCAAHIKIELKDMKCLCGDYLDLREGKWGPYFNCMNCGNVNFKKALENNPQAQTNNESSKDSQSSKEKSKPKEIFVRSDELDFL